VTSISKSSFPVTNIMTVHYNTVPRIDPYNHPEKRNSMPLIFEFLNSGTNIMDGVHSKEIFKILGDNGGGGA